MQICVVIVIYDERKSYLEEILRRLSALCVDEVVIINNNYELALNIDEDQFAFKYGIHVFKQKKNLGSAGGYKLGMEKAKKSQCTHLWLLDEDNLPEFNSLNVLKDQWVDLITNTQEEKLMLVAYRPDLFTQLNPYYQDDILCLTPLNNSFLGFHFRKIPKLIINRIRRIFNKNSIALSKNRLLKMDAAYYGGLFFHKKLLTNDFLPNEKMFLYWDDVEFTHRFVNKGGNIFLIKDSVIRDLDFKGDSQKGKSIFSHPLFDYSPKQKIVIYTRNLLWFSKKYRRNELFFYFMNIGLTVLVLFALSIIRLKPNRLKLIFTAWKETKKLD